MNDYEPTKEDIEESDKFFREFEELNPMSDAEIDKMYEEYCRDQNMSFSKDLYKEAQSALAQVQNTYQAFLTRDTTWGAMYSGKSTEQEQSQSLAQDVAQEEMNIEVYGDINVDIYNYPTPEQEQDISPER